VPATSASSSKAKLLFFLFMLQPLTVLMKQTRQAVRAIKQSILLRCLWAMPRECFVLIFTLVQHVAPVCL